MPQNLRNNLTIAVKAYSSSVYPHVVEETALYLDYLKTFSPNNLIVVTKKHDPLVKSVKNIATNINEIEEKDFGYIKPTMTALKLGNESHLLTLSLGVELEKWQLEHAYTLLKNHNLLGVGWRILPQENDGSYIGKLSYNTAMLYAPGYYDLTVEAGGIPKYVENNSLGSFTLNFEEKEKTIPLGGQEELVLQMRIFKLLSHKKHKLFGHIKHYGLEMGQKTGEGLGFDSKILRKVMTAEAYKEKEKLDAAAFLDSWIII